MIVLFILTFIITAKAAEDTKYIDSLPDKEKEIFIEKVARRILEEVDSKPSKQKNGEEVPDKELNVHDEFVKKILKEEEANLRKHNRNDNEDLSVKPLDKNGNSIDLTVRSRTRRNNNDNFTGNFNADSNLENNDGQSDLKTEFTKDTSSKSDEKDIQIKNIEIKSKDNNPDVKTEPNSEDVPTVSTEKVTIETEILTSEQDHVVKVGNNTLNPSGGDESKVETINTQNNFDTQSTSKTDDNTSFLKNNLYVDKNDEDQKVSKPIVSDNGSNEKHDYKQINEAKLLDIPVQILIDSVTNIEEISINPSTVPTEEVTYTATHKQVSVVENAEKEEITTVPNIGELEEEKDFKRDVNAVTDEIESHTEISDRKTEELSVKKIRMNTVNFGESKINSTDIKNTNNNLFIDLETVPESSVNDGSNALSKKYNTDKNGEIVSASSEKIDKISVHKELRIHKEEDQIVKDSKGTLKSNLQNINIKDDTVKQNIIYVKRETKDVDPVNNHEFEVTTQTIEILTPLIPLTTKYDTKNNEKSTQEVDGNIIQVLRGVIERNKVNANGRFGEIKSVHKIKEHNVYELPKPDKILNVEDTINKEQPYYYPIYNYSPNNAYYNGHNNFGPNQDDLGQQYNRNREQDNQGKGNFEADYFFDDDNNRKFRFGYSDTSVNTKDIDFKLPVVVKYPIQFDDYDNPDIGRKRKKSIKSQNNEKEEESNLKSTLREIRMMMYANKMFGFLPDKTYSSVEEDISSTKSSENTTEKSTLRFNFEAILEREKNKRDKRIMADEFNFADYYFNLMNPNLKSNKIKQKNTGIPTAKDVLQRIFNNNNYKIYFIDPAKLKPRINPKHIVRNQEKKPKFEKIHEILNMANDVDMIPTLNTLLKMNITRSRVDERDVSIHADVLADLIQTDNTALVQYDWLGTTVNIQGATLKLLELTQLVLYNKYVNPSDLELLKYTIYLYKQASLMNQYQKELRMKLRIAKYMKRKTRGIIKFMKRRVYGETADADEYFLYKINRNDVKVFGEFLDKLLNSLYELHTAIKEIASITKYNRQNWFNNLKDLYLKRTRNANLELLLHLTVNRILDLVETSARNGLEYGYIEYIKKNGKEVKRTENEIVFLLNILKQIENND